MCIYNKYDITYDKVLVFYYDNIIVKYNYLHKIVKKHLAIIFTICYNPKITKTMHYVVEIRIHVCNNVLFLLYYCIFGFIISSVTSKYSSIF